MNSLRTRLILGCALVAIVPLVVAMLMLGQHIQRSVRAQAAERLDAALGMLEAQLRADGERLGEKLALLARDPQLKRLYLVEPPGSPALRDHLAELQFLLELDYLWVADSTGAVRADGATAPAAGERSLREPVAIMALDAVREPGVRIVRMRGDSSLGLDAMAPVRYGEQLAGWVRGGTVLDRTLLARLHQTSGVELELRDADGRRIAGTLDAGGDRVSSDLDGARRVRLGTRSYLERGAALAIGREPHARIVGLASTASADETIGALQRTSVLLGLLGVAIAIAVGWLWSLQVSRPVERLAFFSQRISRGEWDEPLALESVHELQTLVAALERMRADLHTYRSRLMAGERQAAYGQMARKVAHEIRNPLTPIAISVADLKRSYDQQRPDFPQILEQAVRTIGEEVHTLNRLLQEFSDFGRLPGPQFGGFDVADLIADIRTLYGHEIAEGRLMVHSAEGAARVHADRAQLRQALVNLVKNGLEAIAAGGRIELCMREGEGVLEMAVSSSGPGLTEEQRSQLFVPGFTTKSQGSGLGLTIVERIVSDHHGTIAVESSAGRGVTFRIRLPIAPEA